MARRKASTSSKRKNVSTGIHVEILAIILMGISAMLFISLYFENVSGVPGNVFKSFLTGLFGNCVALLFPFALFTYAVCLLFRQTKFHVYKKTGYMFIFLAVISIFFGVGVYDTSLSGIIDITAELVSSVKNGEGGGLLGNLPGWCLVMLLARPGAYIITVILGIIDFILWTGLSFRQFIIGLARAFAIIIKGIGGFFAGVKNDIENAEKGVGGKAQKKTKKREERGSGNPEMTDDEGPSKIKRTLQGDLERLTNNITLEDIPTASDEPLLFKGEGSESGVFTKNGQNCKNDFRIADEPEVREYDENPQEGDETSEETAPVRQGTDTLRISKKTTHIEKDADGSRQYVFPSVDLLSLPPEKTINNAHIEKHMRDEAKKLEDTLHSFGVEAKVVNYTKGPAVTRYEVQPNVGVKVSRIVNLSDDIRLNLAAYNIRIEAPIPGKSVIGIEVPNKVGDAVHIRELIDSEQFNSFPSEIPFTVGKGISGDSVVFDLAKMPHVLIAGATGSGKSVCINSLLMSILYKANKDDTKLVLIDPKVVELSVYNGIPHLLSPVVVKPHGAAGALANQVNEMERRYDLFAEKGVREIGGYNSLVEKSGEGEKLPKIVIIIDELADLMMVAPKDVEDKICRLAQKARAAGIHLVLATQRPSVDVITGIIKANIPSRIAFAVSSQVDSRTILDIGGAEKLLGKGDMLFHPAGESKPIRIKGCFVSDREVERVVEHVKKQGMPEYDSEMQADITRAEKAGKEKKRGSKADEADDTKKEDALFEKAVEAVFVSGQASVSMIQRRLGVGYARAGKLVDKMEEYGIIGPQEGSKPRPLTMSKFDWYESRMKQTADDDTETPNNPEYDETHDRSGELSEDI